MCVKVFYRAFGITSAVLRLYTHSYNVKLSTSLTLKIRVSFAKKREEEDSYVLVEVKSHAWCLQWSKSSHITVQDVARSVAHEDEAMEVPSASHKVD
jgi:hypothetical protein